MRTSRLGLVWLFLASAAVAVAAQDGRKLWNQHCAECHGKDGRGRTKEGRRLKITDLSNRQVQSFFSDEQAARVIREGLRDDDGPIMHPFGKQLTDEQIQSLVRHVRSLRKK